jgi:hypothetical protein
MRVAGYGAKKENPRPIGGGIWQNNLAYSAALRPPFIAGGGLSDRRSREIDTGLGNCCRGAEENREYAVEHFISHGRHLSPGFDQRFTAGEPTP